MTCDGTRRVGLGVDAAGEAQAQRDGQRAPLQALGKLLGSHFFVTPFRDLKKLQD